MRTDEKDEERALGALLMAMTAIGALAAAFWMEGARWFVRAALLLISGLLFLVLHQRHADVFWILAIVAAGLAVGSLLVMLMRRTDPARRHAPTLLEERRTPFRSCPGCGETIDREAVPCPWCGHVPADGIPMEESRPQRPHLRLVR